jgi:hypothetical protein
MESVDINAVKKEPGDSPHQQIQPQFDNATWNEVTGEPSEDCDYKLDPNTYLVKGYQCSSNAVDVEPELQIPTLNSGETRTAMNPSCAEQPYPVLLIKVKTEPTEDAVISKLKGCIDSMHGTSDMEPGANNNDAEIKKENGVDDIDRFATVHVNTAGHGDTRYGCDLCEKTYTRKHSLIIHYRLHTGEKPYKCGACEKTYAHKSGLVRHTRTHTGDKPCKCDLCEKTFAYRCDLVSHTRLHTGEKNTNVTYVKRLLLIRKTLSSIPEDIQENHCINVMYVERLLSPRPV